MKTFFDLKKVVDFPDNIVIDLELYSGFSHIVSSWLSSECFSIGIAFPHEKHFWDKAVYFREDLPMYRLYDELSAAAGGSVCASAAQDHYRVFGGDIDRNQIIIAPFCSNLSFRRLWETEKFAELLNILLKNRPELHAVIIGAPDDHAEAERLCSMLLPETVLKVESWCKKADFSTAFNAICRSALFIGVDSAPLHLARLSGVPAVSIWGATSPEHLTREFENYCEVMIVADAGCKPCVHRNNVCCPFEKSCTAMVKTGTVLLAAESLLDKKITCSRKVFSEILEQPQVKL